jgi:hypothetical protein
MDSKILKDLLRTHGEMIESGISEKSKKGKHGTADGKPAFPEEDKMTALCSKKQTKKFVLEYYRERIAQLCAEDDF